jgi:glycine/D-amino acid oxidase-like deaminating enzyme
MGVDFTPESTAGVSWAKDGAIAGTRLVTQRGELGRLPIVDRLPGYSNVWLHCGFGSRGLILHGLTSHYLAQAIAQGDDRVIPACLSVRSDKGISDPSNGRAVS